MKVGIIGAGAAGLTAAYELSKHGHKAIIFEEAPFLGGQASTIDVEGSRLEKGYHHWFTNDTNIIQLTEELGLGEQIRWIDSTVATLCEGEIYDFVTPMDLLKFKPLKFFERLRLGLVTLYLQRQRNYHKYESISAEKWLKQHVGAGGYEKFWEPMLRGKFGEVYYKEISMAWVWGKIQTRVKSRSKNMVREKLGYPVCSFGEIFDVLADRIRQSSGEVHLSTKVSKIITSGNTATGLTVASGSLQSQENFDAIIATTPSYVIPKLLDGLPDNYLSKLKQVEYLGAVLLILLLDRPLSSVYWLNIADRTIPFVAAIEHTNLLGPEYYAGNHIVYLSNYLTADDPLFVMSEDELLSEYMPHIKKINPEFDPSWIKKVFHQRVSAAQPIISVDYQKRIPQHQTPFDNLYLANTTQIYPEDRGTNYSVKMGKAIAEQVMLDFGYEFV